MKHTTKCLVGGECNCALELGQTEMKHLPLSVVHDWLSKLTFKKQTVLLTAIRGCDGIGKHDPSKKFIRKYRSVILHNAVPNDPESMFMIVNITKDEIYEFTKQMDHYPMHWLFHFIHAVEIIGYKHPDNLTRFWWNDLYKGMVDALHLKPESENEMDERLKDGVTTNCWKT